MFRRSAHSSSVSGSVVAAGVTHKQREHEYEGEDDEYGDGFHGGQERWM